MRAGLEEPVPRPLARVLRGAVVAHVSSERRRVHPCVLHAGRPGEALAFEDPTQRGQDGLDHALRTDVVAALLTAYEREHGGPTPLLWLTRPVVDDERAARLELPWLAAVTTAGAEVVGLGSLPPFVIVDRRGWRDPVSDIARSWVRLRPRRG